MAKKKIKKSRIRSKKSEVPKQSEKALKPHIQHVLAVGIFLFVGILFFYPQFQGKAVQQGDVASFQAASKELADFRRDSSRNALWTNSMFSGMPAYQISMPTKNPISIVEKALHLFLKRPAGYFIGMMIIFYLMCLALQVNAWVAIFGSIAFAFVTNHFVLWEAGHATKLRAISLFPIILAGVISAYRSKYLLGGILLAVGLSIQISANHVQMTYFLFISILIYVIFRFWTDLKGKTLPQFAKASGTLIAATLLALAVNTDRLWPTYEYSRDTMRGKPILTQTQAEDRSSSEVEGLAWDYAMQWSNGTIDLLSLLIPRAAGGSSGELIPGDSNFGRLVGRSNEKTIQSPLYWGNLPFTSGNNYVGAIVMFLFVLGIIIVPGRVKWWLLTAIVLTALMSMGKYFEILNRPFFDYFPLFNKFRAPNSILAITEFLIVVFAVLALSQVVKQKNDSQLLKKVVQAFAISGGFCLLMILLGGAFSFQGQSDNYDPRIIEAIQQDRASLFRKDALRSLAFIALAFGLLYFYLKNRVSRIQALIGLSLLVTIDLWGVGKRYLPASKFVPQSQLDNIFALREADEIILKDIDPHFRVLDLSVNTFNSSIPSYHHKTIGGYHAAKLQRYQDMIDYYISKNDPNVLNMLNTRYVIDPQQQLQINANAMGNAWFVSSLREVSSADGEINALQNFNPAAEAIYHQEFRDYIGSFSPDGNGTINLIKYGPDRLEYESSSASEQFAVFSEVWYGPDKGWEAYIDGEPAEFIRVNYILRGMRIPAGEHKIIFTFKPRSYYTGSTISKISASIILIGLLLYLINFFRPIRSLIPGQKQNPMPT